MIKAVRVGAVGPEPWAIRVSRVVAYVAMRTPFWEAWTRGADDRNTAPEPEIFLASGTPSQREKNRAGEEVAFLTGPSHPFPELGFSRRL